MHDFAIVAKFFLALLCTMSFPLRPRADQDSQSQDREDSEDWHAQTNLFRVTYVMWFEVGIEGIR